eukprot:XP_024449900.1 cold shock protein 1 [Populus trichocarpa]
MSFSGKNVAERDLEDFNESMHDAAADEAATELNRMSRPVSLGYATERVSAPMESDKIRYAQPQHRRQTGSVKWFSSQRGYGLTAPSDGSKNVFVHYSSLKSDGRLHLQPNTSIEDEILRGSEGKTEAINATAPGGRLLPNSRKLGPGENITGSSSSKSMSSRNSNTSSFNNVGPCFICGQLGHLAKNHLLNQIYFCPFYICFHYPRH